MKANNLFAKFAQGSVGLQGIIPTPSQSNTSIESQLKLETNQSNHKSIEQRVADYVFSDDALLSKLEDPNLSLSQKINLVLDGIHKTKALNLNSEENKEAEEKSKEFSEKILNNQITPEEYYEQIKKLDPNITFEDVTKMFESIELSRKNEEEAKNYSLMFSKSAEAQSIVSSNSYPSPVSYNLEIDEVEKKFKTFDEFHKNLKTQWRKTNDFGLKTYSFAIISTTITVVAAGVALGYTAAAILSFGGTAAHAAAAWVQTGIMVTFTILAWQEFHELVEQLKSIDKVLYEFDSKSIKDYAQTFEKIKNSQPDSAGNFRIKDFFNDEQITEIKEILSSSEYLENFIREFATGEIISRVMHKVIEKKIIEFSEKLLEKKVIQKAVAAGANLVADFGKAVLRAFYGRITAITTRLGAGILAKNAVLVGTSWANPITQILTTLDYLVTGLDLATTLFLSFE